MVPVSNPQFPLIETEQVCVNIPKQAVKGVSYTVVKESFEYIFRSYHPLQDFKQWESNVACWSSGFSALGLFAGGLVLGLMFPEHKPWIPVTLVPAAIGWGAIGVHRLALAVLRRGSQSQVAQIDQWIGEETPERVVPLDQLLQLKNGVGYWEKDRLNIQQARALNKFPVETLPETVQLCWMMLEQVKEISHSELSSVIDSEGFKCAVMDDIAFFGEYVRQLKEAGALKNLLVMGALEDFLSNFIEGDFEDCTEVIHEIANGKDLLEALQWAIAHQLREVLVAKEKDVTLLICGERIAASREVLASSSDYFNAMFSGKYKEGSESVIPIQVEGIDGTTIQEIIGALHGQPLYLHPRKYTQYLRTAQMLQLDVIQKAVEKQLIENLKGEYDLSFYLELLMEFGLPDLQNALDQKVKGSRVDSLEELLLLREAGLNEAFESARDVFFKEHVKQKWLKKIIPISILQKDLEGFAALAHKLDSYEDFLDLVSGYFSASFQKLPGFAKKMISARDQWTELTQTVWNLTMQKSPENFFEGILNHGKNVSQEDLVIAWQVLCELSGNEANHKFTTLLRSWVEEDLNFLKLVWETEPVREDFKVVLLDVCKNHKLFCQKAWRVLPPEIDRHIHSAN